MQAAGYCKQIPRTFVCVPLFAVFLLNIGMEAALGESTEKTTPVVASVAGTNQSTVITADRMTFDYEKRYGFMESNVRVIGREMTIDADTIMIRFRADNQITNVLATGSVFIRQGGGVATCTTASCDVVSGVMVLTGNPALTRGQEVMKGDMITVVREAGKGARVKVVRQPGGPPATLILGPNAKFDDMPALTGEQDRRKVLK
ncbi:MAG: LptA/OstA family protein [bacterium]